jgi:hypothetical protein
MWTVKHNLFAEVTWLLLTLLRWPTRIEKAKIQWGEFTTWDNSLYTWHKPGLWNEKDYKVKKQRARPTKGLAIIYLLTTNKN